MSFPFVFPPRFIYLGEFSLRARGLIIDNDIESEEPARRINENFLECNAVPVDSFAPTNPVEKTLAL